MDDVELLKPVEVGDYTDFYASLYHATNVGSMFRPDNPLLPNWKHLPIGYHGRASSLVVSDTEVVRPSGQLPPTVEGEAPGFGPCRQLDYELEVGAYIAGGNRLGQPIPLDQAEEALFGISLVNDWSARDLQRWEYQPLGPFLAKSFATTVGPWVVSMEALAPFRGPAFPRDPSDPRPLPYLDDPANQSLGGIQLDLEVYLQSAQMQEQSLPPVRLTAVSFANMYWTLAQMLTHHASNGCNLRPGDLIASGTVSGPTRESRGCLLELTWDGEYGRPVPGAQRTALTLPSGEQRLFLADGDEITLRGRCQRAGFRTIGLGLCRGRIRRLEP
jgi:fumarylacetoacetase